MITKAGYPSETHMVKTEDGYLLTMHRIPGLAGSPTVFLQHGILASSADWVIPGRIKGLGNIFYHKLNLFIIVKKCRLFIELPW